MKYIHQISIILGFTFLGEMLAMLLPLPIPASIYGLVLLFVALCVRLVKVEHVSDVSGFLLSVMSVFFVAPFVSIAESWGIIKDEIISIIAILVITTIISFATSGTVTQYLIARKGKIND